MKNILCFVIVFDLMLIQATVDLGPSEDCTVKGHLPCLLYRYKSSVDNCSPITLQRKFPNLYNNSAEFPGRPGNFSHEDLMYMKHSNGYWYPNMNLTWTPPANVGLKYVKGFEIMQYRDGRDYPACFIFDLTNAAWNFPEDMETVFKLLLLMSPQRLYRYELYTLPKPPAQYDQYLQLQMSLPVYQSSIPASDWKASIYFKVFDADGRIQVTFDRAPAEFVFSSYRVSLHDYSTKARVGEAHNVHETAYNFTQVKKGTYYITVQPNDPYYERADWMMADKCTCQDTANNNACPGSCIVTETKGFTLLIGYTYQSTTSAPQLVVAPSASEWTTAIDFKVFDADGRIQVTFDRAPAEFVFYSYRVSLHDYSTKARVGAAHNVQETAYNFTKIKSGTYYIEVQPNDPYWDLLDWKMGDRCTCKDAAHNNACPGTCKATKTKGFTLILGYTASVTSTPKTTSGTETGTSPIRTLNNEDASAIKIVLAVLGSLFGVALILIMVVMYFKCRKRNGENLCDDKKPDRFGNFAIDNFSVITEFPEGLKCPNNNNVLVKKELVKQPKLVLLYEVDHECHSAVVNNLATYLQQHCHCRVMHVEWQRDDSWIHQDLQQADFVIIVNSEAAFRSYTSRQQSSRITSGSSINSVRNKFIQEERYDNVVMVYFEYTNDQFILPDICPGYKYKLMKHFTDFLLHVHQLCRTDNLAQYDLPFHGNHRQTELGQKLLDSISVAAKYEKENPKWYLRSCSNDDSQLDSGLPDDFTPGQTPITEKLEPWSTDPKQLHFLNYLNQVGHDSITISPEDVYTSIPEYNSSNAQPKCNRNPVILTPLRCVPSIQHSNFSPSPPTASSSEGESIFLPPDDTSDYDAISKSQSEQMRCIVERYHRNVGSRPAEQQPDINNGAYDKTTDLDLLEVQSGELLFTSDMNGYESVSLGGESV